jgi:hypothetical protein
LRNFSFEKKNPLFFLKAKTSNSISNLKKVIILSFKRKKGINKDKGFEKKIWLIKHHYKSCSLLAFVFMKKEGLLNSEIPDLGIHTIKTPLIGRISIMTGFSWSQKPSY